MARLRTTQRDSDQLPTPEGAASSDLSHLVYTRNQQGDTSIYLNGERVESDRTPGDFSNWDPAFSLALANELTQDRPWLGEFHLVAVYNRALTATEVGQNYTAGVVELLTHLHR